MSWCHWFPNVAILSCFLTQTTFLPVWTPQYFRAVFHNYSILLNYKKTSFNLLWQESVHCKVLSKFKCHSTSRSSQNHRNFLETCEYMQYSTIDEWGYTTCIFDYEQTSRCCISDGLSWWKINASVSGYQFLLFNLLFAQDLIILLACL